MGCNLKREDRVLVISGKSKGAKGRVIKVLKDKNAVLVEGVNKAKKHEKPNPKNEQGGIVEREMPVHISNVMLLNPKDDKPVRVTWRKNDQGKRVRVDKKNPDTIIE